MSTDLPSRAIKRQFAPKTEREQVSVVRLRLGQIERLTDEQLAHVGSVIVSSKRADLENIINHPDSTFLQVWVASLMVQSLTLGDVQMFDKLMNRIVGKPKERIEISQGNKTKEVEATPTMKRRLRMLRTEIGEIEDL